MSEWGRYPNPMKWLMWGMFYAAPIAFWSYVLVAVVFRIK